MLEHTTLTPLGAAATGLRVDALDETQVEELRLLLARCGVVVFREQHADDQAFLRFLRSFGETVFTDGETPVQGAPELNVVTNVGRTRPPRSNFHTDTSYVRNPPSYTALRAVQVPDRGGQTLFTDQYAAYETLPADIRHRLAGRTVTHVVTGLDLAAVQGAHAEHPLFLTHPLSRRTALYLSTPQRCTAISGMSAAEAARTIDFLHRHSTRRDNIYRHRWSAGDVVMWDNRCVLHCADHSGVVGDRVMHRGMVDARSTTDSADPASA